MTHFPNYQLDTTLTPLAPFDFRLSTAFIGEFEPTQHEQQVGADTLTKAVMIDGQTLVFRLHSVGTIDVPRIEATLFSDQPISEQLRAATLDRIRFYLSLDDNLLGFYSLAPKGDPFRNVIQKLYGYHQVKFLTPFENACWPILTQRNRIPLARKMKDAIIEKYGGKLTVDGAIYTAFPEAMTLANVEHETLAGLIGHDQKAAYLLAAAHAFSTVDETFLRTGDYDAVSEWLLNIKGIGAWSATFVLIRGLGRMERPAAEKMLLAAASNCYQRTLTEADLLQLASRYGAYQGYWAHYLRAAA